MGLIVDGVTFATSEQGFLVNWQDWNEQVGSALAEADQIELTDAHWELMIFMRDYYQQYKHLPNARVFAKAIAKTFGEDKGNSRYLLKLFPDGPLKYTCKLAGLPKPPTCL